MHLNCSRAICSQRAPMGIKYLAFPCSEIRIRLSIGLGSGNSCSIINSETGFSLDFAFHKHPSLHACLISYYSSGRLIGTEVSSKAPMGSTKADSHPHQKGQWTGCISLTIFFFVCLFFLDICTAPCSTKIKPGCCSQWMLNDRHSDTLKRAGYYITLHIVWSVCSVSALFKTTVTSLLDFFFYCHSLLFFLRNIHAPLFIHPALLLQCNKCGQISCPT